MKFKRIFQFTMLSLSQGDTEGRINSSFANVPSSLCQPFIIMMSQLSLLSARRVFDVVQHIMSSGTSQHCTLVLGTSQGWSNRTHLFLRPAKRELEEWLRGSSGKCKWSQIHYRQCGRMASGGAVLLELWKFTPQVLCIRMVGRVHVKYPNLENTGIDKISGVYKCGWLGWWHRTLHLCVNEASKNWQARELCQQSSIAGQSPLTLCLLCLHKWSQCICDHFHVVGNLPPGSATGLPGGSNAVFPAGCWSVQRAEMTTGELPACTKPPSYSIQQPPVSFLLTALPNYSSPCWAFPPLNFSHTTFGRWGKGAGGIHLFILAVLLTM